MTYQDEWPQERIDRMLHLFLAERRSFPWIADELGTTQQMVAGMVNRLRVRERNGRRRPLPRAAGVEPVMRPLADGRPYSKAPPDRAVKLREHFPKAAPAPTCEPVRFRDLDTARRQCRFGVEGSGPDMLCCGAPVADPGASSGLGASLCPYHLETSQEAVE